MLERRIKFSSQLRDLGERVHPVPGVEIEMPGWFHAVPPGTLVNRG